MLEELLGLDSLTVEERRRFRRLVQALVILLEAMLEEVKE